MKGIDDYNWDSLYRQTQAWMECERIPGRVNTGCRSILNGVPNVEINVPYRGNKSIIDRVSNYRHIRKGIGYIVNGKRYCVFYVMFTENGELDNG